MIFGNSTLPGTFDLSTLNGSNGFAISATDLLSPTPAGDSVAIGDLNDDGFGDIAFGSRSAYPNGLSSAGEVFVVYGHAGAFAPELQVGNLNGSNGFAIEPALAGEFAGSSLAFVSDFNGDGTPDLVIGAPATQGGPQYGTAFVVFGKGGNSFPAHFGLGSLDGTNASRSSRRRSATPPARASRAFRTSTATGSAKSSSARRVHPSVRRSGRRMGRLRPENPVARQRQPVDHGRRHGVLHAGRGRG